MAETENKKLWDEIINLARAELSESEMAFMSLAKFSHSSNDRFGIAVPTLLYKDYLQSHFKAYLENKLEELTGSRTAVDFIVESKRFANEAPEAPPEEAEKPEPPVKAAKKHPTLLSNLTFETFVIGENNNFAANAAIAIAKNPGTQYNPFLIYGGVGLGKTHIMHSIGNAIWDSNNRARIICIPAEVFINEFINSIKSNTTHLFRNKYRMVDVLLIDDIHFLQSKPAIQEELFHTFNALHDSQKQMVFTCDRPVLELRDFTDRLRSRFTKGLNIDLQPPNYETRFAILKKKNENQSVHLPDSIIGLIATNVSSNVRDLEAALNKLVAYSNITKMPLTLENAKEQLKDIFGQSRESPISIQSILHAVAEYFKISTGDLKGKKRTKSIAFPRQIAMHIAREMTEYSTTELGIEFGGRDHTTVMHACSKIENQLLQDPELESAIRKITSHIKESGIKH